MKNRLVEILRTIVLAFGTVTAGCATDVLRDDAPPVGNVEVPVDLVAAGDCGRNLRTARNACRGVARSDGLACGRPGDTVVWSSRQATISEVRFLAGDNQVCSGGVTTEQADGRTIFRCELGMQSVTEARGLAFKYLISWEVEGRECTSDPYVIVTPR